MSAITPGSQRRRLPSWKMIGAVAAAGALYSSLSSWAATHAFMINATDSLPNWAFFVDAGKLPHRGEVVSFSPPLNPLVVAHFGAHPKAFGKLVYGVEGDLVDRDGSWVRVNGVRVAHLKPLSKRGEPLAPGPVGRVPRGCYFAASPHPDGFDSRYAAIGWVCRSQVVGTGVPIL